MSVFLSVISVLFSYSLSSYLPFLLSLLICLFVFPSFPFSFNLCHFCFTSCLSSFLSFLFPLLVCLRFCHFCFAFLFVFLLFRHFCFTVLSAFVFSHVCFAYSSVLLSVSSLSPSCPSVSLCSLGGPFICLLACDITNDVCYGV